MCELKIIILACGRRSNSHTVTKVLCLRRQRLGVQFPKWGRKYELLKHHCGQCERKSQPKSKSSDGNDFESQEDGDAMDEFSE
jgi:hypothetical protein